MRKVELLEVERAALIDLVHREIAENVIDYTKAHVTCVKVKTLSSAEDLDYWAERLHMLRQLKAKLEREEE